MKHLASLNVDRLSRRDFLKITAGLGLYAAGMTLLEACGVKPATPIPEDAPLETTKIRLVKNQAVCLAPEYLAEDILKSDGFTNVQYVDDTLGARRAVASGEADFGMTFSGPLIIQLDKEDPIVVLSGVHVGCFELFGTDKVEAINDLKGKTVAVA